MRHTPLRREKDFSERVSGHKDDVKKGEGEEAARAPEHFLIIKLRIGSLLFVSLP